jgi:transposase
VDLRERVVRAVEAGGSRRAAAANFEVSISFVVKLVQRWHERGTVQPDRQAGSRRSPLAAHAERVQALLAAEPDLAIAELRCHLAAEGIGASRSALGRFLITCGLTRKNGPGTRPSRTVRTSPRPARLARAAAGTGLRRQVYQAARLASRLAVSSQDSEAARRDALRRWRGARVAGLNALQAAAAVGVPVSTLYRWAKQPVPRSRAPRRRRQPRWPSATVRALERLRHDFPMWGKAKPEPLLRAEGHVLSDSTAGRILKALIARGVVQPVPHVRRQLGRRGSGQRHALRLLKGLKARAPGALIQVDTRRPCSSIT